jgi:hypothetical protein
VPDDGRARAVGLARESMSGHIQSKLGPYVQERVRQSARCSLPRRERVLSFRKNFAARAVAQHSHRTGTTELPCGIFYSARIWAGAVGGSRARSCSLRFLKSIVTQSLSKPVCRGVYVKINVPAVLPPLEVRF